MRKSYYYQNDPQDNSDFNDYSDEFEPTWNKFLAWIFSFMAIFTFFIIGVSLDIAIVQSIGPVVVLTLGIIALIFSIYYRIQLICPNCDHSFFYHNGNLLFFRDCPECGAILKKRGYLIKHLNWRIPLTFILILLILGILAIYRNIKINNPWFFS